MSRSRGSRSKMNDGEAGSRPRGASGEEVTRRRATSEIGRPREVRGLVLALLTAAGIIGFLATATTAAPSVAGTLTLRGSLRVISAPISCPPEAPPDVAECRMRTGEAPIPGLGTVSESYTWFFRIGPPTCPSDLGK